MSCSANLQIFEDHDEELNSMEILVEETFGSNLQACQHYFFITRNNTEYHNKIHSVTVYIVVWCAEGNTKI